MSAPSSPPSARRRWRAAPPARSTEDGFAPTQPSEHGPITAPLPDSPRQAPPVSAPRPCGLPAWARGAASTPLPGTAPAAPRLQPGDARFLDAVREAQLADVGRAPRAALWLMVLGTAAALAWAALTRVEQITRTEARVIPDGREQVIASLEGGLLSALLVHEGEAVRAGQPLLRLDPTRAASQQNEGQAKRLALLATQARLQAEASGTPLRFPPELVQETTLKATESEAFEARRKLLNEAVGATSSGIALVQKELEMAEGMSRKGLMSEVEVMRLRRQIIELRQQALERQNRFRQEASTELLRIKSELAQLDEQMVARDDTLKRTEISSPVDGIVKNVRVATVGGVVGAGAPILEIVPQGARLRVEARIKPADIGFVRVGQHAEVKLSAFEYNLYGGLSGTVERISPDALGDADKPPGSGEATWFRAIVAIERSTLQAQGRALPVLPGMTGTVEINTGERSVLDYLLRPLLKAREAFTER